MSEKFQFLLISIEQGLFSVLMIYALQRLGDKITLGLVFAKRHKDSTVSPWISTDGVIKTDKPF